MQATGDRATSVFISYRRKTGFYLAKCIFDRLTKAGHDVFMDVHSLGAGEFERVTLAEIAVRDYFLLVVTSGSLNGMTRADDWLRKELTEAITSGRTVIPVLAEEIKFENPEVRKLLGKLPAAIQALPSFNAVRIPPPEYFDDAMKRLQEFLKPRPRSAPRARAGRTGDRAATSTSAARAQSVLREYTLPPLRSMARTTSTTPWSDLQVDLLGESFVGVQAPTLSESPPLRLSWTKVAAARGYVLEESAAATFRSPRVVYEGSDTTFLAAFLLSEKHYRVKAVGEGTAGDSAWSNVVAVRPPKLPANVLTTRRLRAPTLRESLGNLSWTPVPGAEKYVVEESRNDTFLSSRVVYDGSQTSFSIDLAHLYIALLTPRYRVKAVGKGAGDSEWSNVVAVGPLQLAPRSRLPAPTLGGPSSGGTLTWTEVTGAKQYVLEESFEAGFGSPRKAYEGSATSWSQPAWISLTSLLLSSPPRHYRVKAVGKGTTGHSGWSNVVTIKAAKPVAPPRLPAPTLQGLFAGTLSWSEVAGARTYVLEESEEPGFASPTVVYEGSSRVWLGRGPLSATLGRSRRARLPSNKLLAATTPPLRPRPASYRVKAVGTAATGESDWSNVVRLDPITPP